MTGLKKILRLCGLILLIVLASVGLGNGVPIPPSNRKENQIEMVIGSDNENKEIEVESSEVKP